MSKKSLEYYKTIAPADAKKMQIKLRKNISLQQLQNKPELVGGADISFNRGFSMMHAAIVVLELSTLNIICYSLTSDQTSFPYIPGLLAFREIPALVKAWQQLKIKPNVLILDGHGIAHPRRMGIATHFGIEIDQPAIGCAKNILIGKHDELSAEKGSSIDLMDDGERIGTVLRSRTDVNPIYISPGHQLSFDDTYAIVMQTLTKYKLPRTTRIAHEWANKLRRGEAEPGYYSVGS